jgi:hypothetical protein
VKTIQCLAEETRTSKKENKSHEILVHPFNSSPNVRHSQCMPDEGDISRITDSLKIRKLFTLIRYRCGVNLFGIIWSS